MAHVDPRDRASAAVELGRRLRSERKRQRITQKALSQTVGCAQQTVLDLENGNVEYSRYLPAIAEALGVSVRWLETGEGPPERPDTEGIPIGVVQWDYFTAAATPGEPLPKPTDWLEGCPVRHSADTVCVIADDAAAFAMEGEVRTGQWLFVDRQRHDDGLVVVIMAGWRRAELRQLTSISGRCYLKTTNPELPTSLIPVALLTTRDQYLRALQASGQECPPALCLGRVVFQGVPR